MPEDKSCSPTCSEPCVDFSYAFTTPHRLTVALPDSGRKTLLDLKPGSLRMAWSDEDLSTVPFAIMKTPPVTWEVVFSLEVDGVGMSQSRWERLEGWIPALQNDYDHLGVSVQLHVSGAATAALVKVSASNTSLEPRRVVLHCEKPGKWNGVNPGWVNPRKWRSDHLVAAWLDRADRILVFGLGADAFAAPNANSMDLVWNLQPGEPKGGWIVRPFRAYLDDLDSLRAVDWRAAEDRALDTWRNLIRRASPVAVCDPGVHNAYWACLADLFIMREPIPGGRVAGVPGTEGYRAGNAFESAILALALDQLGYHQEAIDGYMACLEMQEEDGNWADPKGWGHWMWGGAGFKAWEGMEHFRLTGDRDYLEGLFPRLVANTRFQERERAETRPAPGEEITLDSGLMPPGMGDCGLLNGEDFYGVFIPHNIWSVFADEMTLEAARILGKTAELEELTPLYERAKADLLRVIEQGAIQEEGYRWIPGIAGKTCGSRWGALNALFPCHLLPPEDPLIEGTLRKIESWISPGGIPVHTGWMKDGMWVAITLDNLAEAHLVRGNGDAAAAYFYATLNHGTPLFTWCEERGQEPGSKQTSGDLQHLWTPVAVVRCLRDMLVMEDGNGLHLALGTDRSWLASGADLGIANASTHFGDVSYTLRYSIEEAVVRGQYTLSSRSIPDWVKIHIRLPDGLVVSSVEGDGEVNIFPSGECLLVKNPGCSLKFTAKITRKRTE